MAKKARLAGWVDVPETVARETIVPLVEEHMVPEEAADRHDVIAMNFSKALPFNGWTYVKAEAVNGEISEVVRETRVN